MSEHGNSSERISVSRDKLRADLAELELRLRTWISAEMAAKADVKDVDALVVRVSAQGDKMAAIERRVGATEDLIQERLRAEGFGIQKKAVFINAVLWLLAIAVTIMASGVFK